MAAAHTEERLHAAWKHLLLQYGEDVATLVAAVEAERVAGRLFEDGGAAAEGGARGAGARGEILDEGGGGRACDGGRVDGGFGPR